MTYCILSVVKVIVPLDVTKSAIWLRSVISRLSGTVRNSHFASKPSPPPECLFFYKKLYHFRGDMRNIMDQCTMEMFRMKRKKLALNYAYAWRKFHFMKSDNVYEDGVRLARASRVCLFTFFNSLNCFITN